MKRISILWFILVCSFLNAQQIRRKATMGIGLYLNISDSLQKAIKLTTKEGALVKFIVANSTAEKLGIQMFDFITQLNSTPIKSGMDLIQQAKLLRADDVVEVKLLRNGASLSVKGKAIMRPYEQNPNMDITYSEFPYKEGFVRAIYRQPKNKKPLGTVYFVQGIGCYSLDNMQGNDPTKLAIESFINKGFAVYHVEKSGMGDNYKTLPCEEVGYNTELDIYSEGYKHLLKQKNIDAKQIFVFGHSLGGFSAPFLAEVFKPKGVMIYGSGLKPWSEYLQDVYIIQQSMLGDDLATLRENFEKIKPAYVDLFYSNTPLENLLKDKAHLEAAQVGVGYDTKTGLSLAGRTLQFHKELNAHNTTKAWKNTKSFVLTIYGEADLAAIHANDHIAIVDYVNKLRPGTATYKFVPKTSHSFQEVGTMEEFLKMQDNPEAYEAFAAQHFNYKLFEEVCDWMQDKLDKTL
jgi:uncharacterized protein